MFPAGGIGNGFPGDNVEGGFPADSEAGDVGALVDIKKWSDLPVGVWHRYESKVTISTKFGPCDVFRLTSRDHEMIRVFSTRIIADGVGEALLRKPAGNSMYVKSRV